MDTDNEFLDYILVAEALLERATRKQLIESLQILSLNFGCLTERYGDLPLDLHVSLHGPAFVTKEGRALAVAGMRNLVETLAHVMKLGDDHERHY